MYRYKSLAIVAILLSSAPSVWGSTFGYSINLNFGAEQPIRDRAGVFGETVWNNFAEPSRASAVITADVFGDNNQTRGLTGWDAPSIGVANNVKSPNPDDARLMSGFLDSPSRIVIDNLNLVVPARRDDVTYSLILYTYGGRDGAVGRYRVNGQEQQRSDLVDFDGQFRKGIAGNTLVFKDLVGPRLTIETDGFAPVNALSLVYCLPGDFDDNGTVDVDDLEKLNEAVKGGDGGFDFDVNFDLAVDFKDVMSWIKCSKGTCVGDVNLDGLFNSSDLIQLFQEGAYESGDVATWTSGDWNGDCKFDSSDLLVAFQEGCYEVEGAFAEHAIPEPVGSGLLGFGLVLLAAKYRRRHVRV